MAGYDDLDEDVVETRPVTLEERVERLERIAFPSVLSSREEKAGAGDDRLDQLERWVGESFDALGYEETVWDGDDCVMPLPKVIARDLAERDARITELERERDEARQKRDEHFAEVKRAQAIIDDLKLWRQSIYNQSINADRIAMLLSEHPEPDSRSFVAVQIAEQCDKAIANARCFADDRAEKAEAALAELRGRVLEIANGLEGFTHLGASKIHYLQRELRALLSPEGEAKDNSPWATTPDSMEIQIGRTSQHGWHVKVLDFRRARSTRQWAEKRISECPLSTTK